MIVMCHSRKVVALFIRCECNGESHFRFNHYLKLVVKGQFKWMTLYRLYLLTPLPKNVVYSIE